MVSYSLRYSRFCSVLLPVFSKLLPRVFSSYSRGFSKLLPIAVFAHDLAMIPPAGRDDRQRLRRYHSGYRHDCSSPSGVASRTRSGRFWKPEERTPALPGGAPGNSASSASPTRHRTGAHCTSDRGRCRPSRLAAVHKSGPSRAVGCEWTISQWHSPPWGRIRPHASVTGRFEERGFVDTNGRSSRPQTDVLRLWEPRSPCNQ